MVPAAARPVIAVRAMAPAWPEAAEGEATRAKVDQEAPGATLVAIPVVREHWAQAVQAVKTAPIPPKAAVTEEVAAGATMEAAAAGAAVTKHAGPHTAVAVVAAGRPMLSRMREESTFGARGTRQQVTDLSSLVGSEAVAFQHGTLRAMIAASTLRGAVARNRRSARRAMPRVACDSSSATW